MRRNAALILLSSGRSRPDNQKTYGGKSFKATSVLGSNSSSVLIYSEKSFNIGSLEGADNIGEVKPSWFKKLPL